MAIRRSVAWDSTQQKGKKWFKKNDQKRPEVTRNDEK